MTNSGRLPWLLRCSAAVVMWPALAWGQPSTPEAADTRVRDGAEIPRGVAVDTGDAETPPSKDEPAAATPAPRIERLDRWRRDVWALVRGQLDPGVDADALLSFELTSDALLNADDLAALARAQAEPPGEPPNADEPERASANEDEARDRLIAALAAWSHLDPTERRAKLDAHRSAAAERAAAESTLRSRLEQAERSKEQLEAFLDGSLDPTVDPTPLLRIDLVDGIGATAEIETDALRLQVDRAEQDLANLRRALLRRPASERQALLEAHRARGEAEAVDPVAEDEPEAQLAAVAEDAEEAALAVAREKERALAAAKAAETEAHRRLAEELAHVLGVKEAQARFEVELAERRVTAAQHHEDVAAVVQRVADTSDAVQAFATPAEDPDALYDHVRGDLRGARDRLDTVLGEVIDRGTRVPRPEALLDHGPEVDPTEIRTLHRELIVAAERLEAEERELRWTLADDYRRDIVDLNEARLDLLAVTSPELRHAVTGFGPTGVRQASEEAAQIAIELRYRGLSLPRHLMVLWSDLRTSPVPLLLGLLQFVALVLVFRWWRRRAPDILAAAQRPAARSPGRRSRPRSGWITGFAWYLGRVRRPLEWLAVAAAVYYGTALVAVFPEIELLWLVVLWLLLGSTSILLVDAIAAREHHRQGGPSQTAHVRIRSLRLIGLSIAYTGLVLSLADALVGKGAIYTWVLSSCWLLAIPIALLLTRWWRDDIFATYEREPQERLASWIRARTTGWASYPAAMIGGLALLARGSWRWFIRHAARFEGTRHVLAYLFRREVARQAEATGQDQVLQPIDAELHARFVDPSEFERLIDEVAADDLARLRAAIGRPGSTFSVVVAERGLGKSTLLAQLLRTHEGPTLALECPASGLAGLVEEMARRLDLEPGATLEDVAAALRQGGPRLVTLDDIQRLVQPTIGGMRGLDDLGRLARLSGPEVSVVATIGAAAWQYVSRARGDRLHFDEIIHLAPWDESSICTLMERRSEALDITPSFEGLVIPRQYDDDELQEDRRTETGYYRILWDYAGGNPHVASWFWAESLFEQPGGQLIVRLFREPPASELDALPLTLQFVLRALVQLETATKSEVSAALRMQLAEAQDALRFAVGRGYAEEHDGIFSISWPWYRAVTRMLHRQHLLAT